MRKSVNILVPLIVLCFKFTIAISEQGSEKISFWNKTQKGANIFNSQIILEDLIAAKAYGISFIRLAPDKFPSQAKDFLIGDTDHYVGLIQEDYDHLEMILDTCAQANLPVVLTMLSLPGSRWKQNNKDQDDLQLWQNKHLQKAAAKFWQDLASKLHNHPAIIGYNILNEPHLERLYNTTETHIYDVNQEVVQQQLFDFYQLIISNIRAVDKVTPIILDSSAYASPKTFQQLKIHADPNILYSFHMYEPYEYTTYKINQGLYKYPGLVQGSYWDKNALKRYMEEVINFQKINKIPNNHILVGEFGGDRRSKGLSQYFQDLIDLFQEQGWHFAFYAFREDGWDGMDYELGDRKLPASYWQALEKGDKPKLERKDSHPQFQVLKDALND